MSDRKPGRRRRSALGERQKARVPEGYSPGRHLIFTFLSGAALFVGLLTWLSMSALRLEALLIVPVTIALANGLEYSFHRWPMHRRLRRWRVFDSAFRNHTLSHHRVFDEVDHDIVQRRDLFFVLTSSSSVALTMLFVLALTLALRPLVGHDAALLAGLTLTAYALALELLHLAFHLAEPWQRSWLLRNRVFQELRALHRAHHDPHEMTKANFNIVVPLTDWAVGTLVWPDRRRFRRPTSANGPLNAVTPQDLH